MREVEAVKTTEQRQQVEAHPAAQGAIYADMGFEIQRYGLTYDAVPLDLELRVCRWIFRTYWKRF